jgi:DNA-binding transcriptional ArsR family regulator
MRGSAGLFKVLSADTRIGIIELLKEGPKTVNAIAELLGISQSAVSQHLRILKAVGLVSDERQGYWINYSLNEDKLGEWREQLNQVCTCGCSSENCYSSRKIQPTSRSKQALERYRAELKRELRRVEDEIKRLEK